MVVRSRPAGATDTRLVEVQEIMPDRLAMCVDSFGAMHRVPVDIRRGGGQIPQPGQYWILDRFDGQWAFASLVSIERAGIEGSVIEGSANDNLLALLDALGFIHDDATRVSPGVSDDPIAYRHVQPTPSDTWTVEHDLGYWPGGVSVVDSAKTVVHGTITHLSVNALTITFRAAFSGEAFIS
jgi:hypothetical protein